MDYDSMSLEVLRGLQEETKKKKIEEVKGLHCVMDSDIRELQRNLNEFQIRSMALRAELHRLGRERTTLDCEISLRGSPAEVVDSSCFLCGEERQWCERCMDETEEDYE